MARRHYLLIMKIIDHDPNERPRRKMDKVIWGVGFLVLAFLWGSQWHFDGFEWGQIGLGFITGVFFAYFIVDWHIAQGRSNEL